ncbi:hypothetical protein D3C71_890360 [compost metagenome]
MAPVAAREPARSKVRHHVVATVDPRAPASEGRDGGLRILRRERPCPRGVPQLRLPREDGAFRRPGEIHRIRQRGHILEIGPGLASQPVVPAHISLAQGYRVSVGDDLVACESIAAATVHVSLDIGLELVTVVGRGIGTKPETRELRMHVGVTGAAAIAVGSHGGRRREIEEAAGRAVSNFAIAGAGIHRVQLDEATEGELRPRHRIGHHRSRRCWRCRDTRGIQCSGIGCCIGIGSIPLLVGLQHLAHLLHFLLQLRHPGFHGFCIHGLRQGTQWHRGKRCSDCQSGQFFVTDHCFPLPGQQNTVPAF